jgi:hypothetical protein
MKNRILTGDRPTGPLRLGHFVGSLQNESQETLALVREAMGFQNYQGSRLGEEPDRKQIEAFGGLAFL